MKRRESVKKQLSVVFPRADRAAARTSGRERKFLLKISSSELSYTPARESRRLLHEIHSLKILLPSIIKNDHLRSLFFYSINVHHATVFAGGVAGVLLENAAEVVNVFEAAFQRDLL